MKISNILFLLLTSLPSMSFAAISLTSTADGKAIDIPASQADTPAAKEFLNSGKNTYIGNTDAIKAGKKVFQLYSCTACHGSKGEGAVGPNLIDDKWNYAKNVEDKGIFETIWAGTAGGMGAKGKGLMQVDDPTQGLTVDETLKVVAFIRSNAVGATNPAQVAEPKKEAVSTDATNAATPTEAVNPTPAPKAATSTKSATKKVVSKRKPVKKAKKTS